MSSSNQEIKLNIETAECFEPMFDDARYKGLSGGRGSAKSHFWGEYLIEESLLGHVRVACMREIQNSIKDSVKQLLEDKIRKFKLEPLFKITEREIVGPNDSLFIFRGLRNHTASSIKSLEGFNRALYEEAQTLSQRSLDLATPTFRSGAQQLFAWNPEKETDPVDSFFLSNKGDPDFRHVHCTYADNPWFPEELRRDMERDRKRDFDKYLHVWEGHYVRNSEARVFKNWEVKHFDIPQGVIFRQGADWGYSIDPMVLIRCFLGRWENGHAVADENGKTLFVCHEVRKLGVEIDHTGQHFDLIDPEHPQDARDWPIIADSENPQAISYLRRHGYPRVQAAIKGPGSVKEGIKFLQSYDIVVHPRCIHTKDELTHYCFKTDPLTGIVLPVLPDKKNHVIDSLRYAVEPLRKVAPKLIFGDY